MKGETCVKVSSGSVDLVVKIMTSRGTSHLNIGEEVEKFIFFTQSSYANLFLLSMYVSQYSNYVCSFRFDLVFNYS